MVGSCETQLESLTDRILVNGSPCEASLSPNGRLTWRGEEGERCLMLESEALGFESEDGHRRIRVRAFVGDPSNKSFVSCGAAAAAGKTSVGNRIRKDYVLEMETDEMLNSWNQRLRDFFNSLGRPKQLFILLNPFGGKKCARKIFQNEIKPLLVAAGILYTLEETSYQLHAQEIANKLDLLKYDGIVCVSGDGVLVEIVNGLLQREDWSTAIKIPLGIIPAGTGNGMAKSLMDSVGEIYSISNVTFSIIKGQRRVLDVTTVMQGAAKFFSVLMVTWGLIADIDIESEKYRWMGSARLDFYVLLRIMNLRRYHGRAEFVPAPGYEAYGEPLEHNNDCKAVAGSSNGVQVQQGGYQGPLTCSDNLEWRFLDGPFIAVWLNNVPWSAEDIKPAPEAKFADGYLDVVIIKDCSKSAIIALMMQMGDGSHLNSPNIMYLKVKAFRLEPGQRVGNPRKGGIIDSDGEVLARGEGTYNPCHKKGGDLMAYGPPIEMFVDKGLATIYSP